MGRGQDTVPDIRHPEWVLERGADASDSTVDVLESQLRAESGPLDWHRLDGSADAVTVLRRAQVIQS